MYFCTSFFSQPLFYVRSKYFFDAREYIISLIPSFTSISDAKLPRDCSELVLPVKRNGSYVIFPYGVQQVPASVRCEFIGQDAWTVSEPLLAKPMRGSRGGAEGPDPLKYHQNIGYFSNTGPDPLENHEATEPAFNGTPAKRPFNGVSLAGR